MCVRVPTEINPAIVIMFLSSSFLISSSFSGMSATLFTASFWSEESLVVVLSSSEGDFSRDCSGERSAELLSSSIRMRTEGLEWRTSCCSYSFFFWEIDSSIWVIQLSFLRRAQRRLLMSPITGISPVSKEAVSVAVGVMEQ